MKKYNKALNFQLLNFNKRSSGAFEVQFVPIPGRTHEDGWESALHPFTAVVLDVRRAANSVRVDHHRRHPSGVGFTPGVFDADPWFILSTVFVPASFNDSIASRSAGFDYAINRFTSALWASPSHFSFLRRWTHPSRLFILRQNRLVPSGRR